ncbi:hypothetical protein SARC_06803, partial [Sphaeroforma arctica JP610]
MGDDPKPGDTEQDRPPSNHPRPSDTTNVRFQSGTPETSRVPPSHSNPAKISSNTKNNGYNSNRPQVNSSTSHSTSNPVYTSTSASKPVKAMNITSSNSCTSDSSTLASNNMDAKPPISTSVSTSNKAIMGTTNSSVSGSAAAKTSDGQGQEKRVSEAISAGQRDEGLARKIVKLGSPSSSEIRSDSNSKPNMSIGSIKVTSISGDGNPKANPISHFTSIDGTAGDAPRFPTSSSSSKIPSLTSDGPDTSKAISNSTGDNRGDLRSSSANNAPDVGRKSIGGAPRESDTKGEKVKREDDAGKSSSGPHIINTTGNSRVTTSSVTSSTATPKVKDGESREVVTKTSLVGSDNSKRANESGDASRKSNSTGGETGRKDFANRNSMDRREGGSGDPTRKENVVGDLSGRDKEREKERDREKSRPRDKSKYKDRDRKDRDRDSHDRRKDRERERDGGSSSSINRTSTERKDAGRSSDDGRDPTRDSVDRRDSSKEGYDKKYKDSREYREKKEVRERERAYNSKRDGDPQRDNIRDRDRERAYGDAERIPSLQAKIRNEREKGENTKDEPTSSNRFIDIAKAASRSNSNISSGNSNGKSVRVGKDKNTTRTHTPTTTGSSALSSRVAPQAVPTGAREAESKSEGKAGKNPNAPSISSGPMKGGKRSPSPTTNFTEFTSAYPTSADSGVVGHSNVHSGSGTVTSDKNSKNASGESEDDNVVAFRKGMSIIKDWCDKMRFSTKVYDTCETNLELVAGTHYLKIDLVENLAAIIFISARMCGVAVRYKEIAHMSGVPVKMLNHAEKLLKREAKLPTPDPPAALDTIKRFLNNVKLPSEIFNACMVVCTRAWEIVATRGKCPISLATGVLVLICQCPEKDVVRVSNVSITTIKNAVQQLSQYKETLLEGLEVTSRPDIFKNQAETYYGKPDNANYLELDQVPSRDYEELDDDGHAAECKNPPDDSGSIVKRSGVRGQGDEGSKHEPLEKLNAEPMLTERKYRSSTTDTKENKTVPELNGTGEDVRQSKRSSKSSKSKHDKTTIVSMIDRSPSEQEAAEALISGLKRRLSQSFIPEDNDDLTAQNESTQAAFVLVALSGPRYRKVQDTHTLQWSLPASILDKSRPVPLLERLPQSQFAQMLQSRIRGQPNGKPSRERGPRIGDYGRNSMKMNSVPPPGKIRSSKHAPEEPPVKKRRGRRSKLEKEKEIMESKHRTHSSSKAQKRALKEQQKLLQQQQMQEQQQQQQGQPPMGHPQQQMPIQMQPGKGLPPQQSRPGPPLPIQQQQQPPSQQQQPQ